MRLSVALFLLIMLVSFNLSAYSPLLFKKESINFGDVPKGRVISVEYQFENVGEELIRITKVETMGCKIKTNVIPKECPPGNKGSIFVTLKTKELSGYVSGLIKIRVVSVRGNSIERNYVIKLSIRGYVDPSRSVTPKKTLKNNNRLFAAVRKRKIGSVLKVLKKPTSKRARSRCLLIAVKNRDLEIVKALIHSGEEIDLEISDKDQRTPLMMAFADKSSDMFYYLIASGANAKWYIDHLVEAKLVSELERIRSLNPAAISAEKIQVIKDDLVFEEFKRMTEFQDLFRIIKKHPSNRHADIMLDTVYKFVLNTKDLNQMKQLKASFPNHKQADELSKQIAWKDKAHEYRMDAKEYEEVKDEPQLLNAWINENRYSLVNKYRKKYEEAKTRLKEILRLLREFDENKAELSTLRTWVNQNKYVMQDNYKKIYAMIKNRLTALENAQIIQVAQRERLYPYPAYIDVYHPVSGEKLPNPGPNDDIFYNLEQTSKRFLELQEILMDTTEWLSENSSYKVCKSCLNEAISRSSSLMVLNKKRNFGYYNKCRGAFIQAYNEFKCISGNCVNGKGVKVWTNKVTNRSGIMKGSFVDGHLSKGEFLYYLGLDQKPENLITAEYGQFWTSTAEFKHYLLGMLKKGVRITADGKREEGGYTVDSTGISWDDGHIKASDIGKILLAAAAAMIVERLVNGNDSATDGTATSSSSDRGSIIFKVEGQWFFGNIKSVKIKLQGQTRYITYEESGSSGYVSFVGIPYETYNVTVYAYEESGLKGKYHSLKATVSHKCKTTDVRITTGSGGLVDPQIYVNCY